MPGIGAHPTRTTDAGPLPDSIRRAGGEWAGAKEETPSTPYSALAALCPIGAFDSGMGGLSVLLEIRNMLPAEDIAFFADNGNIPYGGRSDEWLRARAVEIADFLLDKGAKIIVVACNTASAAGLEHLRARYTVPIIGLVPSVKPAVALTKTGKVGVLATRGALRGRLLADVIERFATPAGVDVVTVAPEGLVEAVERGDLATVETAEAVRRSVAPMVEAGADAIVLGCTHYPFLKPLIRRQFGDKIALVDSGEGVARQTARVLQARNLLCPSDRDGTLTVYTTGDPETVAPVVQSLVGDFVEVLAAHR